MNEIIIISFLLAFIVFTEIRNYIERKNLLDRIMAKSYNEFVETDLRRTDLEIGKIRAKQPRKPDFDTTQL